MTHDEITLQLADEAATARLGADLAAAAQPGDVFALQGDLGAGKTTLARGFIRAMSADPALDVPSPTFTLAQAYEARIPVHHFDLYRIGGSAELDELGLDEAIETGVALVEWPERATGALPPDTITVAIAHEGDGRLATIRGLLPAMKRVRRSLDIRAFLEKAGMGHATRTFLLGDASTRAYETAVLPAGGKCILMNAARQPDGPPIRDGKPYSQIAHLAESVVPFVAIARALKARGLSAPDIYAQDLDRGLLLIEHLGDGGFLDAAGNPVAARYLAAAELLAFLHGHGWPRDLEAAPGIVHHLPAYDREALSIESELLVDWYLPAETGRAVRVEDRMAYAAAWQPAFHHLESAERSLVLRDFHSPNIIWRDGRSGHDRLGLIDFQDALWGPSSYDVASLAQDARVTISPELERAIVEAYCLARENAGGFDRDAFEAAYAITAAQRNSKILGIFVRLNVRDGKPHYLKHLPRIRDYVARSLRHPALVTVRDFFEHNGIAGAPR